MPKYKYWKTEKLEKLLDELKLRSKYVNEGISDISFIHEIESILIERENRDA
jgi:hypothetical protein